MVVLRMLVVRTQNFLSPAARVSGTSAKLWIVARGSGTNAKFSSIQPLVVMVWTQNSLSTAVRVSSARVSGTNEKCS